MTIKTYKKEQARIDYGIILSLFLLFIISIVMLYATTVLIGGGSIQATLMQVFWYIIGLIGIITVMQLDFKALWKLVPYIYWLSIILLIAVLFFYDRQTALLSGAKSWFRFGPFSFQPSEFSKIALILMLSFLITQHNTTYRRRSVQTDRLLLKKMGTAALPIVFLVVLQNDLGTTLVLFSIIGGMLLISGISSVLLLAIFGTLLILGGLLIYLVMYHRHLLLAIGFKAYQFSRIDSWLQPFENGTSASYQIQNALLAIATGGLFGKGIGVTQTHIPVRSSDMIFSTIGENTGLVGSLFLIFIYCTLVYQMLRVCFDIKNEFYTYIAVGVISMIVFHVFENIGMNIGLLPLTGIPLPFISQGGSSLVVNMLGVGLILAMRYQADAYQPFAL